MAEYLSSSELLDAIYDLEDGEERFIEFAGEELRANIVWSLEHDCYRVEKGE